MFRTSSNAALALPWLATLSLLCAMTVFGPEPARAQSAKNLDCKKCVNSGDIAKKAITKKQIDKNAITGNRIKDGTVDMARLGTDLQDHVGQREAFYIVMDGNTTRTIATHGPLTLFARCLPNQPDGSGGLEDRIEIVATSSLSGWFEEDESDNDLGGNLPIAAGDEVFVNSDGDENFVNPSGGAYYDDFLETTFVAPDGSYLAIEGEAGGIGLNIFGHDCILIGNIHRFTGTL